jgi:predicted kinase
VTGKNGNIVPVLYVLIGLPASGKSTWVSQQFWTDECAYISTDHYVDRFAARTGHSYNQVFEAVMPRAIRLMMRAVRRAQDRGLDIIWDQTNLTRASRARKFRILPEYRAVAVVFAAPEPEEHARRLAGRPGKRIPDTVLATMIKSYEAPDESEGFEEIWYAQ